MKKLFSLLILFIFSNHLFAQLQSTVACPGFSVDILAGKVNGLEPNHPAEQIKKMFPCFTDEIIEKDSSRCQGILSYKDKDIYFFTGRDYVEIGPNFKGKLSLPLFGTTRGSLFGTLGHPTVKDAGWDAFQTQYGILVLYYNSAKKVNKIQFSKKSAATLKLCE